jgi:hypothetical protein
MMFHTDCIYSAHETHKEIDLVRLCVLLFLLLIIADTPEKACLWYFPFLRQRFFQETDLGLLRGYFIS